jgi:hypothetical protein
MGVFYIVEPFNDEMASLLEQMGAAVPESDNPSRNPTPAELREACAALKDFKTRYTVKAKKHWQALISREKTDEGTILEVRKFSGSEGKPHSILFEKGTPRVILELLKHLAGRCGPLVVIPDTGEAPIAVTAESSVRMLLDEWEHTRDMRR